MASCMQHLYMMPQARASILGANTEHSKHEPTLKELQRMFAYLLVRFTKFGVPPGQFLAPLFFIPIKKKYMYIF